MISWIIKTVGSVLVIIAAVAFLAQLITGTDQTTLGGIWFAAHSDSLNLSQAVIQRYIHPAIWDPALQWFLTNGTPLGVVLTGVITFAVGRFFLDKRSGQDAEEDET